MFVHLIAHCACHSCLVLSPALNEYNSFWETKKAAIIDMHGSNTNLRVPNLYTKIVCILPAHGTLSHSKLHGWYLDV